MHIPEARIELPAQDDFLKPAVDFVLSFAARFGRDTKDQGRLKTAVSAALEMVIGNNEEGKSDEPVALKVREAKGTLRIEILNRGVPILLGSGQKSSVNSAYFAEFHEASKNSDRISIENSGRLGQSVILEFRLGAGAAASSLPGKSPRKTSPIPKGETISIRGLAQGEEEALSRLFYLVYGYNYINEIVYHPEKLREMLDAGDLISLVAARPNGRLVGHVGLVRRNTTPPVYEAAMGIVDPAVKSSGLFSRLFAETMKRAQATRMQYCLFDIVTNHDLSQKHIAKFGLAEMSLLAGCQTREHQASLSKIGLGPDPEGMDRYSLLLGIIPQVKHPFGTKVGLPESLGEPFGFLLKPLGLRWFPSSRFEFLPSQGAYKSSYTHAERSAYFDFHEPGRHAAEEIVDAWQKLMRDGYQYAGVDVPVDAPGLGQIYDILSSNGFFAGGFVPHHLSDRLGFRFQAVGPAKVAFDKIKMATDPGKRLLKLVKKDYESSCLL